MKKDVDKLAYAYYNDLVSKQWLTHGPVSSNKYKDLLVISMSWAVRYCISGIDVMHSVYERYYTVHIQPTILGSRIYRLPFPLYAICTFVYRQQHEKHQEIANVIA